MSGHDEERISMSKEQFNDSLKHWEKEGISRVLTWQFVATLLVSAPAAVMLPDLIGYEQTVAFLMIWPFIIGGIKLGSI